MSKLQIDYSFQPDSYWGDLETILSNVKGAWRRQKIKESIENKKPIPSEILRDSLSSEVREYLSSLHPSLMGGEYLPSYKKFEVEIARVVFQSVTQDVMSFRARLGKNRIYYRIVDEHEMCWKSSRKSSVWPLTLKQLIKLILDTYVEGEDYPHKMLIDGTFFFQYLEQWQEASLWEHEEFLLIDSDFYPDLGVFFGTMVGNWIKFCQDYHENPDFDSDVIEGLTQREIFEYASGQILRI